MSTPANISLGFPGVYIQCHWDGDPLHTGLDLYHILRGHKLVHGFCATDGDGLHHNGFEDLFAYLVMRLKKRRGYPIGNVYLQSGDAFDPETDMCYCYTIGNIDDKLTLDIYKYSEHIYSDYIDNYGQWLRKYRRELRENEDDDSE